MYQTIDIFDNTTLLEKGFIGVLYMKHRVLYSTPKNLLC